MTRTLLIAIAVLCGAPIIATASGGLATPLPAPCEPPLPRSPPQQPGPPTPAPCPTPR